MKKAGQLNTLQIQLNSDEAFTLSNPKKIEFPNATSIKPSLMSTLSSFLSIRSTPSTDKLAQQIIPIHDGLFLLLHGNAITVYEYWESETEELFCNPVCQMKLDFYVKCIKISPWVSHEKRGFHMIAEQHSSYHLETLFYDHTLNQIQKIGSTRLDSPILCWSYIQHRQILLWCNNMKIYHYELTNNVGLRIIQTLQSNIRINEEVVEPELKQRRKSTSVTMVKVKVSKPQKKSGEFKLKYCTILGQRGKEQESTIVLFYVLYNQELNGMKIKCKQIKYPLESDEIENCGYLSWKKKGFPVLEVIQQEYEIISSRAATPESLKTVSISQIGRTFLVRFEYEIIMVKKKFQKDYLVVDNIYKKNKECSVFMSFNSNIVSSITKNIMEISRFDLLDNRITTKIIDFLDISQQHEDTISVIAGTNYSKDKLEIIKEGLKVHTFWVASNKHPPNRNNIYFVFEIPYMNENLEKRAYILFKTKHTSKIRKIVNLVHKIKRPEEITSIQKLGEILGVSESDFFFNVWKSSKMMVEDIFHSLLRCGDYRKIIEQLKGVLRKRTFPATRVQKILQTLEESNLDRLKKNLNEDNLIDYFNSMFVSRKMQIYESNFEIDEKQFTEMTEISLFNLVRKIIDLKIYTKVKEESVWAAAEKTNAKLNLIQVMNLFKLPLLEEYDSFLISVLSKYPISIVNVIFTFPELLPYLPFENLAEPEKDQANRIQPNIFRKPSIKQTEFFQPIKEEQFKTQSNLIGNVFKELYPYFATSVIKKSLGICFARKEVMGQKFCFHSIIEVDKESYKAKISKISCRNGGLYLFMVVLDCLIKGEYKEEKDESKLITQISDVQKTVVERAMNEKEEDVSILNESEQADQYDDIRKLCEIFVKNYELTPEQQAELVTISCLFRLLIDRQIIDMNQYSLWQIAQEPIEKWVALFFLGNKQEKDLIFTQFMGIFNGKTQGFLAAMHRFIDSEHCSKIQLTILIDLITSMGKEFQCQNQKIIQIILDGFCARVQIQDILDASHFSQRLKRIYFGPALLMKAEKIQKLGTCHKIFSLFFLEETLLKDLLQNTVKVIENLVQNYFMGQVNEDHSIKLAVANGRFKKVQITSIRDVFQLMNYLQENVLYDLTAEELIIAYCKKLVEWQAFDEIDFLLHQSGYIQDYKLDLKQIIIKIQSEMLLILHSNLNFTYAQPKNKDFINKILDISPDLNQIVVKERAKIAISDIFLEWKYIIKSKQIEEMCELWEKQIREDMSELEDKKDMMHRIIETYAEHMNIKYLEDLCNYLTIAVNKSLEPVERDERFYHYCTSLCDALIAKQKYQQACQIISIINEVFQLNYSLMSECMLKSLVELYVDKFVVCDILKQMKTEKYSESESKNSQKIIHKAEFDMSIEEIEDDADPLYIAKCYIDLFIESWKIQDEECFSQMFQKYFPQNLDMSNIKDLSVAVHPDLLLKPGTFKISLDFLWEVICRIVAHSHHKIEKQDALFGYFFLEMGLTEPSFGFEEIQYISYNHEALVRLLTSFMDFCEKDINSVRLKFLDYSVIFKKYLDALTKILVMRYHQINDNDGSIEDNNRKGKVFNEKILSSVNLNVVREEFLKNPQYKTDPLTITIENLKNLTIEAEKICKRKIALFGFDSSARKFNLSTKLKGNNTKRAVLYEDKEAEMDNDQNENEYENEVNMMSFDFYTKVKNKVKSNNSFTDAELSERIFAQSFLGIGDKKGKGEKVKELELLREIISSTRKEMEERQEEEEQKRLMLAETLMAINTKKTQQQQQQS